MTKYKGRLDPTRRLSARQVQILTTLSVWHESVSYLALRKALGLKSIGENTFQWLIAMGYVERGSLWSQAHGSMVGYVITQKGTERLAAERIRPPPKVPRNNPPRA